MRARVAVALSVACLMWAGQASAQSGERCTGFMPPLSCIHIVSASSAAIHRSPDLRSPVLFSHGFLDIVVLDTAAPGYGRDRWQLVLRADGSTGWIVRGKVQPLSAFKKVERCWPVRRLAGALGSSGFLVDFRQTGEGDVQGLEHLSAERL